MTNFNIYIDGSILLIYLVGTIILGLSVRRYLRGVQDYLVAGRRIDLFLGIASLAATEFGIVTCMANAQLGYKYGFVGITPGISLFVAMLIVGWTGFCIKPLRKEEVITIPELFEKKFGPHVRWASGLVIVLGGLLNMGVFLRMAGDFLTVTMGIDGQYLELMMTILLIIVVAYTMLGGMLSVLITDYLQFVVMGIGLITVTLLFFFQFGWNPIIDSVEKTYGTAAFIPFQNTHYGWDRILLDILIALATVLTWQTMITRILAARNYQIGQRIYVGTSPFFLVRFTIPAFLGMAALYYFNLHGGTPNNIILALPKLIALAVPIGLIGILIAAMLAADMSTTSSYLLAWSSVIYNDLLGPIHQNKWPEQKAIRVNRFLIAGIGLFLLLYGLWYPLKGDLWGYLQVTGTIYLSSMMVILIAACYWEPANDWGAMAAIAVGSIIPISFLLLQEIPITKNWMASLGAYKSGVVTYFLTGLAMIIGSYLKPK